VKVILCFIVSVRFHKDVSLNNLFLFWFNNCWSFDLYKRRTYNMINFRCLLLSISRLLLNLFCYYYRSWFTLILTWLLNRTLLSFTFLRNYRALFIFFRLFYNRFRRSMILNYLTLDFFWRNLTCFLWFWVLYNFLRIHQTFTSPYCYLIQRSTFLSM
jgi:hypothetical protein